VRSVSELSIRRQSVKPTGRRNSFRYDVMSEAARAADAILLDDLADAVANGARKEFMESLTTVPLSIIDDFRNAQATKLPLTAAEDLLEILLRRYERERRPD
jgi:hypothetical protein